MFAIHVNDMTEVENGYRSLFGNDAKIMRGVEKEEDCFLLQSPGHGVGMEQKWVMEFNNPKIALLLNLERME